MRNAKRSARRHDPQRSLAAKTWFEPRLALSASFERCRQRQHVPKLEMTRGNNSRRLAPLAERNRTAFQRTVALSCESTTTTYYVQHGQSSSIQVIGKELHIYNNNNNMPVQNGAIKSGRIKSIKHVLPWLYRMHVTENFVQIYTQTYLTLAKSTREHNDAVGV